MSLSLFSLYTHFNSKKFPPQSFSSSSLDEDAATGSDDFEGVRRVANMMRCHRVDSDLTAHSFRGDLASAARAIEEIEREGRGGGGDVPKDGGGGGVAAVQHARARDKGNDESRVEHTAAELVSEQAAEWWQAS